MSSWEDFGKMFLNDTPFPGTVTDVSGFEKPIEWASQKAIDSSGATTIFRGVNLAEGIEVTCALKGEPDRAASIAFNKLLHPNALLKPPAFNLKWAGQLWVPVKRVTSKAIVCPKVSAKNLGIIVYKFTEHNPARRAPAGKPEPAQLESAPKPKDEAEAIIAGLLDEIQKT